MYTIIPTKHIFQIGILLAISCIFILPSTSPLVIEKNAQETPAALGMSDIRVISVALYDTWGVNNRYIREILNYPWKVDTQEYRFEVTVIDNEDILGEGNISLTRDNFDVFIIGASAMSYLVDGLDKTWSSTVKNFVGSGGGYLGICGGANAASSGFESPRNLFHRRVNQGVLGLADVYINDNFLGEWQYLLKFGFDAFWNENEVRSPFYISVNTTVEKHPDNSIFSIYTRNFRDITYAGGPGMYTAHLPDDKLGEIIPLLRYNEEPMKTKPLHYWRPALTGWKILRNVTTDLEGTFAGVATTYNSNGRVVLYGPHPEDRVVVDGIVEEYLGRSMVNFIFPFDTYVFNYFGTQLHDTYNWWIVRRSVAWAANIPDLHLPPIQTIP